ncbi:MAG TPA: HAD family acid phosphatase [Allosphingosinicella sp.]|nr:HAD family acid phosphatase [Allosphingosinicella sp.]
MAQGQQPSPMGSAPAVEHSAPPADMRYLFGSGEAAALSEQAYNALVDHVRLTLGHSGARRSAVLAPGATLANPRTLACGGKPPAAVFDMDETAVLNLGYEYDQARTGARSTDERWLRWERTGIDKVAAVPGAVRAFDALRRLGVTVIVNTNRDAVAAAETERALAFAGLGAFRHGKTLFLKGDVDGKGGKDGRRSEISRHYCVIAMGGDQLGDFSDLFAGPKAAERRAAVMSPALRDFFGRSWFVLPNPVYGTGLYGHWDEVFPRDKRWTDPGPAGGR